MWCARRNVALVAASLLSASRLVYTYELDFQSTDSMKSISKQMAQDLMTFYTGNKPGGVPGLLPEPYYWWEGGALMGALIDYWYYTGDTTYNDITQQGLLHQVGPYKDYMPPNQTLTEGNDDQGFWGMAVMTAAEYNFQDPPEDEPQWLALAQAVFNTQAARWDTQQCSGGLRWQIFTWNTGFNYKNSISQACFFNIAARLALYTGNGTYADWAVRTWDWMVNVNFIDRHYRVYDGAHVEDNCTAITPYEFSYNAGAFLLGAAAMVAYSDGAGQSGDTEMWHERVDGLLNSTEEVFFFGDSLENKVMFEVACEGVNLCDVDQQSFKAYLSRWLAATTKWAPWTFDRIKTLLQNSAVAATRQCTGGDSGRLCGLKWANNSGEWDGTSGVGQQMAAMEVVLANMIQQAKAPVTNSTGGTSAGNPSAGGSDDGRYDPVGWQHGSIDRGDRAGAAICTLIVLASLLAALVFMIADETKSTGDNWDNFRSSLSQSPAAVAAAVMRARAGRNPSVDEKGKRVASERSSSTGTGDKIPAAYGGSLAQPPPAAARPDPAGAATTTPPASDTVQPLANMGGTATAQERLRERGHAIVRSAISGPRSSVLKKPKGLSK